MINRDIWHDDMGRLALAFGTAPGDFPARSRQSARPRLRAVLPGRAAAALRHALKPVLRLCWGVIVGLLIGGLLTRLHGAGWPALIESRVILAITVSITAIALDVLAGREQHWRQQALIDPLTGVLNRRSFLELSGREDARARRGGRMLSVLMLDIDHFKRINDSYGHPAGDAVIKQLARPARRRCVRATSSVATVARSSSSACPRPRRPRPSWSRNGCAAASPTPR
ncbi:MAG: GGDEF domain-containing protein [Pseudomonadota bacterium]